MAIIPLTTALPPLSQWENTLRCASSCAPAGRVVRDIFVQRHRARSGRANCRKMSRTRGFHCFVFRVCFAWLSHTNLGQIFPLVHSNENQCRKRRERHQSKTAAPTTTWHTVPQGVKVLPKHTYRGLSFPPAVDREARGGLGCLAAGSARQTQTQVFLLAT